MPAHPDRRRRRTGLVLTAATALVAAGLAAGPSASAATTSAVYDATPTPLPPNVTSLGFQATSTSELGDRVHLGAGGRQLQSVTVTMSTWAVKSDYTGDARYPADSTSWSHPVTITVYGPSLDGSGVPDTLLATTTTDVAVPWRPEADPTCATTTAWRASDGDCYNGLAFDATAEFGGDVVLPDDVIVGVAFDTQSYGAHPEGTPGPYNSLNVGVPSDQAVSIGSDADPDEVFWNTSHAGSYGDKGAGGVGTFRADHGWSPYGTVALSVRATGPAECSFTDEGTTRHLDGDCETDHTVTVPDGFILDGDGHTITAVDPQGGHFTGAVVASEGATAGVRDLVVTADGLADVCDGAAARLTGILLDGASGSVTGTTVTGLRQGTTSGCQEGNAVVVRNDGSGARPEVTLAGNTVTGYQKNGITITGNVAATVTGNTVTGDGPVAYIAQNGIQVSYGATAYVRDNRVTGNDYVPADWTACGLLLYEASGVKASHNDLAGNQKDLCNYGKGGGKYQPGS